MAKTDKIQQHKLNDKQLAAIPLLAGGMTDSQVAERIGATPQTVNGWKRKKGSFIVELNKYRNQLIHATKDRLRILAIRSIEVLAQDIESDDPKIRRKAALQLIRGSGILNDKSGFFSSYPETPEGVELENSALNLSWLGKQNAFDRKAMFGDKPLLAKKTE